MQVCEQNKVAQTAPTLPLSAIASKGHGVVKAQVVAVLWQTTAHGKVPTKLLLCDCEHTQFEARLSAQAAKAFAGMTLGYKDWLQVSCDSKWKAWSTEDFQGKRAFPYPYNKMTHIMNVSDLALAT